MARNGSGTYSKVNTFVAGNTITAAGHNQNWDDLVTEMTNSVAADGQTTMTGALKASNGTVALPAYSFGSDTDLGFYRIGANNIGLACGSSTKVFDASATGIAVTGTLSSSGALTTTAGGHTITAGGLTVTAGNVAITAGDFAIATNKFTVANSTGNTAVAGTLGVTGNVAVNTNKFNVTAASGNTTVAGTLDVTGAVSFTSSAKSTSPSAGIGYATGAGSTVTQITSKTTSVTINAVCGQITTHNANMNAGAALVFTVNNTSVATTDVVFVCLDSGGTDNSYLVTVDNVGISAFNIHLRNLSGGPLAEALTINFVVIKSVTS